MSNILSIYIYIAIENSSLILKFNIMFIITISYHLYN